MEYVQHGRDIQLFTVDIVHKFVYGLCPDGRKVWVCSCVPVPGSCLNQENEPETYGALIACAERWQQLD